MAKNTTTLGALRGENKVRKPAPTAAERKAARAKRAADRLLAEQMRGVPNYTGKPVTKAEPAKKDGK